MERRRILEHFVVAGLSRDGPHEELRPGAAECGYRETAPLAPVTDICVVFPGLNEAAPEGFTLVDKTPSGHSADLNHGSIRTQPAFLCLRRGHHKPPLVDIGVLNEGKGEKVMVDSQILHTTPFGRPANVNNGSGGIFLTYRRAAETAAPNLLAVTDVCVILPSKGEEAPHTFCKIPKNLNRGLMGSDVFLCYKKSHAATKRIAYKPSVLAQFPPPDTPGHPALPPNVDIFCLPMGAVVEAWPAKCQLPARTHSTFILTEETGRKLYGVAVTFYQRYEEAPTAEELATLGLAPDAESPAPGSCSDNSSTNDPADQLAFLTNKAICLVSRFPFFTAFKRFLFFLHRMGVSGATYPIPIERYISYLLYEVPFPSPRRPRVLMNLGQETISFDNPDDTPLPLSGAGYLEFLKSLGVENGMYVLLLALMEKPILIHSLRPFLLTSVAEAVASIIFPFRWQCPYIPQCPLDLAGVLHAPMSFICGVDSRYFELYEDPPRDVTAIDLDTNTISNSETRQHLRLSCLPRRPAKILKATLERLMREIHREDWSVKTVRHGPNFTPLDIDLQMAQRRRRIELEIQGAFLRFMASLMSGYKDCLKPLAVSQTLSELGKEIGEIPRAKDTDLNRLFNLEAFLGSRGGVGGGAEFWRAFCGTQGFTRFVEERSLLSDHNANAFLAFFDECVAKLRLPGNADAPDLRLLDLDPALASNHTSSGEAEWESERAASLPAHFGLSEAVLLDEELCGALQRLPSFAAAQTTADAAPTQVFMEPGAWLESLTGFKYEGFPSELRAELFELEAVRKRGEGLWAAGAAGPSEAATASFRHKQELRLAQRVARQEAASPLRWAKCLLAYAYSLWFLLLPAGLRRAADQAHPTHPPKGEAEEEEEDKGEAGQLALIELAFAVLEEMQKARVPLVDEVPYRILMQMCCQLERPLLTVKAYLALKEAGHSPNAITYGFYNRAVLDASWSKAKVETAKRRWIKLRHTIGAIARLKANLSITDSSQLPDHKPRRHSQAQPQDKDPGYASSVPEDSAADEPLVKPLGEEQHISSSSLLAPSKPKTSSPAVDHDVVEDPLGALAAKVDVEEPVEKEESLAPDSALNSSIASVSTISLLREDEPLFQGEEFRDPQRPQAEAYGRRMSGWLGSAKRWASPASRLVRSQTTADGVSLGSVEGETGSVGSGAAEEAGWGAGLTASPSLSGLVASAAQSRLWKGMGDVISRQAPHIRHIGGAAKAYVSPVVRNISEGLSTPMRQGVSFEATGGPLSEKYLEIHFRGADGDNDSLNSDEMPAEKWHRPITALDDLHAILPPSDPAFALSTRSLPYETLPIVGPGSSPEAGPVRLLSVALCSATRCPKCSELLFDADLQAGWASDERNLNSRCLHCLAPLLPLLSVRLRRGTAEPTREEKEDGPAQPAKHLSLPNTPSRAHLLAASNRLSGSTNSLSGCSGRAPQSPAKAPEFHKLNRRLDFDGEEEAEAAPLKPIKLRAPEEDDLETVKYLNVPFLSPLVLRRELEAAISSDGEGVLAAADLLQAHPILFWNLLYFFQRLGLPSHLPAALSVPAFWPEQDPASDKDALKIRCTLDSPHLHSAQYPQPLYRSKGPERREEADSKGGAEAEAAKLLDALGADGPVGPSAAVSASVAALLRGGQLFKAIKLLIQEHRRRSPMGSPLAGGGRGLAAHFPLFRDLELVGLASLGEGEARAAGELGTWLEAEVAGALARLPPSVQALLPPTDAPPSLPAIACRRVFRPLQPF